MTRFLAMSLALLFVFGACGDDGDAGGDGDLARYCELNREFEEAGEAPDSDRMDEFVEAAPAEIKDEAEVIADALENNPGEASEEVSDAGKRIDAFFEENCEG